MEASNNNSNSDNTQVKNESRKRPAQTQDEKVLEDWARSIFNRPIPQIPVPGQGSRTYEIPANKGFDISSAIGRFTWHVIGEDKFIPSLYRFSEKYCCIRRVEADIMGNRLNVLPQDIYDAAKLISHYATAAEAKLLTHINSWHCDNYYGIQPFTEKDLVVTVEDVEEFYSFLKFAHKILDSGENKDKDYSRCGFVKVNDESLIPYTVLRSEDDKEKGVPLFYFEGETDILKVKAKSLSGWDLAYLKLCCKVQGVRKELIQNESLSIVKLTDLKSYFPKRTVFTENCWPASRGKSLLPKNPTNNNNNVLNNHIQQNHTAGNHLHNNNSMLRTSQQQQGRTPMLTLQQQQQLALQQQQQQQQRQLLQPQYQAATQSRQNILQQHSSAANLQPSRQVIQTQQQIHYLPNGTRVIPQYNRQLLQSQQQTPQQQQQQQQQNLGSHRSNTNSSNNNSRHSHLMVNPL